MKKSTRKLIAKYTKEQVLANAAERRKAAKYKRKKLAELKSAAATPQDTADVDRALDNSLARENLERLKAFDALSKEAKKQAIQEMKMPRIARRKAMYNHIHRKVAQATGDRP